MKALNKRTINYVCTIHARIYGVNKKFDNADMVDGYCDICEAKGQHNTPQNVIYIDFIGGIAGDDLDHVVPVSQGQMTYKPTKEKTERLVKEETERIEKLEKEKAEKEVKPKKK